MRRHVIIAAGIAGMMLLMGIWSLCLAQSTVGAMNGTVTDPSGAVVTGASIEVTSNETGAKRTTTTNDKGVYTLPNLEAGLYTLTVTAISFAPATVKDVKVSVSFTTSVNLELKPGTTSETVEVTGADAQVQINTTDQQLSTLIDNKKILELPLLSRDPNALILLSPGVFQTNSGLGGFTVNGSRERNNNFLVDGTDNNDTEVPGIPGGLTTPNIDATQEFRVITNNFNAEFGRNTGAIINVVTKGGTNEFHGGAYEYVRSNTFSARNFFDTTGSSDPLHRNQFGGSVGGPIIKNRLFFFANYEGDRFNSGAAQVRAVPSAAARLGILPNTPFGTLDVTEKGRNNPNGFPINPTITQLINAIYPLGNDPLDAVIPGSFDAFRFIYTFRDRKDTIANRVDYQINEKNHLYGSYGFSREKTPFGADTFPGLNDAPSTLQRTQLLALTFTSIITPKLINEARFGFNRTNLPFFGPGDGGVSTSLVDKVKSILGSGGVPMNIAPFGGPNGRALNLSISGIESLGSSFDTQDRFTGTTTVGDAATYIRGSHTFKGGFETRAVYSNGDTNFSRSETIFFSLPTTFAFPILKDNSGKDIPTVGLGATINNYASFLYGLVGEQFQAQFFNKSSSRTDNNERGFRTREFDFFFQDTWRVRPNFTLNYGIRYEFKGVPYEVNGLLSTLVDEDPSGFTPAGGFRFQLVGKNSPNDDIFQLYDDDYNNFAPRFGFAWDPFKNGKTSIRGGYGVFYDRVFGNLFTNARGNLPFEFDVDNFPAEESLDAALITKLPRVPTQKTRFNAIEGDFLFPVFFPIKGKNGKSNNPYQDEFRTPYSQNYNFGIQRELLRGFLLEVDYVGTKGTKLLRVIDGNLISVRRKNAITGKNNPITSSSVRNYLNGSLNTAFFGSGLNASVAFSTYQALQVRITKTFNSEKIGTGQIQGAYTYSHSIDNAEDPLVPTAGSRTSFPLDTSGFEGGFNLPERGESGFDTRQRVVVNFIYEFPFKSQGRLTNALLGGWSMSGIIEAQSGNPFSIYYSIDTQGTGLPLSRARFAGSGNGITPNPNANPRLQTGPLSSMFLNPSVFIVGGRVLVPGQGDVPRSAFTGPNFATVSYAAIKRFKVTERHQFQLRADFFNLFNRVNLGIPVRTATSPLFGQSLSAGDPRIIQFVFRYNF